LPITKFCSFTTLFRSIPTVRPGERPEPGQVEPTRPGDTGTWRRLTEPATPRESGERSAASERLHRFTDNLSLRARLTLIYGMLRSEEHTSELQSRFDI